MACLCSSILLREVLQDITHAQTVTRHFVGICRTDALTRSAYLVLTFLGLVGSVQHAVCRHDEMCLLRDVQTRLQLVAALLQCFCLVHEEVGSQHHAIADDVHLTALEDARGDRAQHVLLAFELQRVTGVGTTLEASHYVILRGQHVDHLTFSFVAPLESQQNVNLSFVHCFCVFLVVSFFFTFLFCRVSLDWHVEQIPYIYNV